MKTNFFFFMFTAGIVCLSVTACKTKKQNMTSQKSAKQATSSSSGTASEEKFRLVVSFYSIGQGIDGVTHDKFVEFMKNYYKKIHFEPIHWGREGETDYCLTLSGLTPEEQEEFVYRTKNIVTSRVHVRENATCSQKGEKKYRLVVSFYSMGEGIDLHAHKKFETLLANYLPKVKYETTRWGREGEIDYCFTLAELSTEQQQEFVHKVKETISTHVEVRENSPCKNKR